MRTHTQGGGREPGVKRDAAAPDKLMLSHSAREILEKGFLGSSLEQIEHKLRILQQQGLDVLPDTKGGEAKRIQDLLDELNKVRDLVTGLKSNLIKDPLRANTIIFLRRSFAVFPNKYDLKKAVKEAAVLASVGTGALQEVTEAVQNARGI
ncbi:MAG: hypothetical protein Q7K39_00970 [Candidatus Magasanikbacteria bacterium]|nr:hypothetical protein [Candidatus Magasanikbacteria bacterium]